MNNKERLKNSINEIAEWFRENGRKDLPWRQDREPYHVWISEIMLQQTRIEAVLGYYKRFLEAFPSIKVLSEADDEKLMKMWEGLGYYSRARNIKKAAEIMAKDYDASFPETKEEIEALPGIGAYTAGAIGSICFDLPTPAVDGNVLRVITRILKDDSNISKEKTKKDVRNLLSEIYPEKETYLVTEGIMELGEHICIPNGAPLCEKCPVRDLCLAGQDGTWEKYPVKDEKKARRVEKRTVLILKDKETIAIQQRPSKGLLAKMWEFPSLDGHVTEKKLREELEGMGVKEISIEKGIKYRHIFSHVEWDMKSFVVECNGLPSNITWASKEELEKTYAIPGAFQPFVKEV